MVGHDVSVAFAQDGVVAVSGVSVFGLTGLVAIVGVVGSWVRMETRLADMRDGFREHKTRVDEKIELLVPREEIDRRFDMLSRKIDELPEKVVRLIHK